MRLTLSFALVTFTATLMSACGGGDSSSSSNSPTTTFSQFSCPSLGATALFSITGVRGITGNSGYVYYSGTYSTTDAPAVPKGYLYSGPINGGGSCNQFSLALANANGLTGATSLSLYGPDNDNLGSVSAVGSYSKTALGINPQLGLLYQGPSSGVSGTYSTIQPPSNTSTPSSVIFAPAGSAVYNTIIHSNNGGISVGNYDYALAGAIPTNPVAKASPVLDTKLTNADAVGGHAVIYNLIGTSTPSAACTANGYCRFSNPNYTESSSDSITAYGIWFNGGTSYTITGGYANSVTYNSVTAPTGTTNNAMGFIADWDSKTQLVTNFTPLNYNNLPPSTNATTHFEGITPDTAGTGYNLAGNVTYAGGTGVSPALTHVTRNANGTFNVAATTWTLVGSYPNSTATSADTVYLNYIMGVATLTNSLIAYIASVVGQ